MDAISAYRDALKTIETIRRGSLRADDARTTFSSRTKDVFDEAAAALIEMAMNEPSTNGDLQGQAGIRVRHVATHVVDIYADVCDTQVEVFVRDRGAGFDPESIPADRQGVRNSILDRMSRHGGTAEIRSTPGSGTEVRMKLPGEERTQ